MSKKQRQADILDIINLFEIDTQEELTERLNKKGYKVSQATVSRDISELRLIKTAGENKKFKYAPAKAVAKEMPAKMINLFKQVSKSIVSAENLIVVKTLSGNAGAAGLAVDEMRFEKVVGTIAGDDTLLIITKTPSDAELILKSLRAL